MYVMISIFIFLLSVERSDNRGNEGGRGLSKPILKVPFGLYGIAWTVRPTWSGEHSWSRRGCPGVGRGRESARWGEIYLGDGSWNVCGDYYA